MLNYDLKITVCGKHTLHIGRLLTIDMPLPWKKLKLGLKW